MKALNYVEEMEIPEGTNAKFEGSILVISKGKAMIKREFHDPRLQLKVEGNKIILQAPKVTRKEKMQIGTFVAHIKNMLKGVNEPYVYKLRICSGHFPMNIAVTGKTMLTVTESGFGKRSLLSEYPTIKRAGRGVLDIKTDDRNGDVVTMKAVGEDDEKSDDDD